jgi:hypothetical protein
MIKRRLGMLVVSTFTMIATSHIAAGSHEVVLALTQMDVTYGGQDPNGMCCEVDTQCQDPLGTCAQDANPQRCVQQSHPYIYAQYAWFCATKIPLCGTCDCSDWLTDSNGTKYYCLEYYRCTLLAGVCTKSTFVSRQQGHFSCGDNCPGPP